MGKIAFTKDANFSALLTNNTKADLLKLAQKRKHAYNEQLRKLEAKGFKPYLDRYKKKITSKMTNEELAREILTIEAKQRKQTYTVQGIVEALRKNLKKVNVDVIPPSKNTGGMVEYRDKITGEKVNPGDVNDMFDLLHEARELGLMNDIAYGSYSPQLVFDIAAEVGGAITTPKEFVKELKARIAVAKQKQEEEEQAEKDAYVKMLKEEEKNKKGRIRQTIEKVAQTVEEKVQELVDTWFRW